MNKPMKLILIFSTRMEIFKTLSAVYKTNEGCGDLDALHFTDACSRPHDLELTDESDLLAEFPKGATKDNNPLRYARNFLLHFPDVYSWKTTYDNIKGFNMEGMICLRTWRAANTDIEACLFKTEDSVGLVFVHGDTNVLAAFFGYTLSFLCVPGLLNYCVHDTDQVPERLMVKEWWNSRTPKQQLQEFLWSVLQRENWESAPGWL